ncbi:MAG: leucine-rich repeat domain-containing protein, partial [Lachnospiraceae bacterium]|nr:leucine-rich repeat domain-containing protein [Lachnospiraceae bacterium]
RELGKRCFEHCCSLKEIYISDLLETIPERAFFRCKSLHTLFIPASVNVIENEAFAFCNTLKDVYVSEKTYVADTAFVYCDEVKIHRYAEGFDRDDFRKVML